MDATGDGRRRSPPASSTHPSTIRLSSGTGLDFFADDTALGEVARPEDVANLIAFLASGLARHATGTTVDVNGASYVR